MALAFGIDASGLRRFGAAALAAATLMGAFGASDAAARDNRPYTRDAPRYEQRQDRRQDRRQEIRQDRRYDRRDDRHDDRRYDRRDDYRHSAPVVRRHDDRRIIVPPRRHERRWIVGRPLPRDFHPYRYDYWAARGLRRPPHGHYYARIDDDLLLIRIIDRAVIRLVFSW